MPVPPLNHRVLHPGIGGVGFRQRNRNRRAVDQVQYRNRDDEGTKKPVGDINVWNLAFHDGAEKHHRIRHPDQGNQDVDRPLEFGILFTAGETEWQRHCGEHDDQLPAPKSKCCQGVGKQARMAGSLYHVIRGGKQRAAAKRKNHRVRMQRTQATVGKPGAEVKIRPDQLGGNDDTDEHADDAPHHCHDRKLPHHTVVVCGLFAHQPVSRKCMADVRQTADANT